MKLTNNLTLDSQLEKYRALGFDKYRLSIIIAGLAKGLDVSQYLIMRKFHLTLTKCVLLNQVLNVVST